MSNDLLKPRKAGLFDDKNGIEKSVGAMRKNVDALAAQVERAEKYPDKARGKGQGYSYVSRCW